MCKHVFIWMKGGPIFHEESIFGQIIAIRVHFGNEILSNLEWSSSRTFDPKMDSALLFTVFRNWRLFHIDSIQIDGYFALRVAGPSQKHLA